MYPLQRIPACCWESTEDQERVPSEPAAPPTAPCSPLPRPQQQAKLIRAGVLLKGLFVRKEEIELFGLGLGKQELSLCERTNRSGDEQNARGTKTTRSKQNLFFFLMCRLKECLGTGLSDWFLMSHLYGFP